MTNVLLGIACIANALSIVVLVLAVRRWVRRP